MFKIYSKILFLLFFSTYLLAETSEQDLEQRLTEVEDYIQKAKKQKGFLELKTNETVLSVGGRVEFLTRWAAPTSKNIAGKILSADADEKTHLNFKAAGSRLWVKTRTPSEYGVVRTLIETDFDGSVTGTQTNSNSSGLRLRHAYAQIGNWTIGQTNSAFNSFVTLDILEYPINDIFVRQALIRYTIKQKNINYDISFEQPETTLRDENGTMKTPSDDIVPDLVLRTRYYGSWGEFGISLLGRYINQEEISKDSAFAWATNISTKVKLGKDDIRIGASYGSGIGRYISYNSYAAGYFDAQGNIELQNSYGGHLGYRHWWRQDLRSTLAIAYTGTQNNSNVKELDKNTKEAYTSTANIFWSPILNSLVGFEYTNTKVKAQSDLKSDLNAWNFCLRYDF